MCGKRIVMYDLIIRISVKKKKKVGRDLLYIQYSF